MGIIKIWLDDVRPAPKDYEWVHSVNEAKALIEYSEHNNIIVSELNLDHDMGDFEPYGGDGIKLVLWLAETKRYYPVVVHSFNPVGKENMESVVKRYWK